MKGQLDYQTLYKMHMNFFWFTQVKYFSPGERSVRAPLQVHSYSTHASSIYPSHQVRVWLAVETQARSRGTDLNHTVQ